MENVLRGQDEDVEPFPNLESLENLENVGSPFELGSYEKRTWRLGRRCCSPFRTKVCMDSVLQDQDDDF